jgi:hypothetical protein
VIQALLSEHRVMMQEAIMNLPHNALDFLDVFIGLRTRYRTMHLIR